jgi:hypothetical protein
MILQEGLGGARVRIARRGHDGFVLGGERLDHRPTLPACGTEYEVRLCHPENAVLCADFWQPTDDAWFLSIYRLWVSEK